MQDTMGPDAIGCDMAEVERKVRQAAPEVRDIFLFGSRARGDARSDSDIDLLVIVPNGCKRRDVAVRIRLALWGVGVGVDLVTLTEAELVQLQASEAYFHRQMLAEARPLHEAA